MATVSVLVCGGGQAAQVVSCLFSSRYKVTALSLFSDEASRWQAAVQDDGMTVNFHGTRKQVRGVPDRITNDPSFVRECNMVLLTVTAACHEQYFEALEPYVRKGTIFAVMPARSGCDFLFRHIMGNKAVSLVTFETLPWSVRVEHAFRTLHIIGTKETVGAAVLPAADTSRTEVLFRLQGLLGVHPMIVECPNVMSISLGNPGQIIHPGITYARWSRWGGEVLAEKAPFYHGADEFTAQVLLGISSDIGAICHAIRAIDSSFDTSQVRSVYDWYMDSYADSIADPSTLLTAMRTNSAFAGLMHPMKQVEGGYMPDFKFRYLSEDVPTGLCFSKGVAVLLGVKTDNIDKVILWSQDKIGKSFINEDGSLVMGEDLRRSRAPQAFGITTKANLIAFLGLKKTGAKPRCGGTTVCCMGV